jgi:sRNA-binding regulator protein Hfq
MLLQQKNANTFKANKIEVVIYFHLPFQLSSRYA